MHNLPNFLNPNHVLNKLVSPGYFLINSHMKNIVPDNNHCPTFEILLFIPQASRFQNEAKIWINNLMNSSSSYNPQLDPTRYELMRK